MNSIVRLSVGAAAIASLYLLTGCNTSQSTFVAEINGEPILADEYYSRVMSVTTIPQQINTDAGGVTMINMINDKLTEQLAKKLKIVTPDELVNAAVDYQLRMDPNTAAAISSGKMSKQDLTRQKRFELDAFGIGTNGDKASEQELNKAYDEYKDKPEFRIQASYNVKILKVPDDATGRKVIGTLKQTGDFKGAAQNILGMQPAQATVAAKEERLLSGTLPPDLREALDKLKPNEISSEPITIKMANPQQPLAPTLIYAVAQLKSKEPEHKLTKPELVHLLSPVILQKSHPNWKEHYQHELSGFTRESDSRLRVALPRYESLVDTYIRTPAKDEATGHPAMGMPSTQPGPGP